MKHVLKHSEFLLEENFNNYIKQVGKTFEALELVRNDKDGMLLVKSNLSGKEASAETFKNKNLLKANGFNWNGTAWAISNKEFDKAKKVLSDINKVEYVVKSLEELEEMVDEANLDNKNLIKQKIVNYIDELAAMTDEAALSAEITRYLEFFARFYQYSYYNRILIFLQRPNAKQVASYKAWQAKHRQVVKGAKGITIFVPINVKYNDTKTSENGDEELDEKSVLRFKSGNVFDISDTEAINEQGKIPEEPKWFAENEPSEVADKLITAVKEVCDNLGINITEHEKRRSEKGYSAGDHINISSDVKGVAYLSVLIHELAHELMHWKKSSIYYIDNGVLEKGKLQELQAESVAFVVLRHYELPVKHSTTYLALWKANSDRIKDNLEKISKVAEFIIKEIDKVIK